MSLSKSALCYDVAVIGAGISGLSARLELVRSGLSVLTLEKSRGLGGRASTRRGPDWAADLGAQFTSIKDPQWREFLLPHMKDLREVWVSSDSQFPRFIHTRGMSALARCLEESAHQGQPIELKKRVISLTSESSTWEVRSDSGEVFRSRSLLLAVPLPQAIDLLQHSEISLGSKWGNVFSNVEYSSCFALGILLNKPLPDSVPPIFKDPSPRLAGIYDQKRKGLETQRASVVIQTNTEFASDIWAWDDDRIKHEILNEASRILLEMDLRPEWQEGIFLHRWRYSEIKRGANLCGEIRPKETSALHPPLALVEDALEQSSVEGAFQAGLKAAKRIISWLGGTSHAS